MVFRCKRNHLPMLTVCSYHVTYTFHNESTLYRCLSVKELLGRSRRNIWRLSECNGTWTHNHLVRKRAFNHLAELANLTSLAKWLSVRLRTNWLWVRVPLHSLPMIPMNFQTKSNPNICTEVHVLDRRQLKWVWLNQ